MDMKIKEEKINYNNMPFHVFLGNISHMMPHFHETDLEIIFCLKGSVNLVAGHQMTTISENEVFSVDSKDIHYLYSDDDNISLLFHLDMKTSYIGWDYLKHVMFACESTHCYPFQYEAMGEIKNRILSLAYAYYCDRHDNYNKAVNEIIEILLEYFNWFNYENQDNYINHMMYDRFHNVVTYCFENYHKKITLSQLAEMEHIGKNYLSQFMSKTVFMSFVKMMRFIRCYAAAHMLLTTDLPISEISHACGFSDPKYFYSTFKYLYDCTPTEHRMKYMKYMNEPTRINEYDKATAAEELKNYIVNWHTAYILTGKI